MNQLHRAEITIYGDVQTVGYRYAVRRLATKLKIQGYVQNMPDGTVKMVAEAPKNTIAKFIKAIQIKEPPIIVEHIDTKYVKPKGEFKFFTIKYGELAEEMAEGFGTGLSYMRVSRDENKQGFQMVKEEIGGVKEKIGGLRGETRQGFHSLRKEIGSFREESRHGFQTLRDETRGGFHDLKKEFTVSRTETKQGFQTLRSEMKGGFQGLKTEIKGMREDVNKNFGEMATKYDAISNSLSEAVKTIQSESVKTRTELIRVVDNLSRLVQEFIKETRRRRRERIER